MKYIVTLNDKQYEVEVEKGKAVAGFACERIILFLLFVQCQRVGLLGHTSSLPEI